MARKKLLKYDQLSTIDSVLECKFDDVSCIKTISDTCGNFDSVTLELGCGKGEYTTYLAQKNSKNLCIGLDIKGDRLWKAAQDSQQLGLENVLFVRSLIHRTDELFSAQSIDTIWITFPDPFPRDRDAKRRLTSPRFIEKYMKVLKVGGVLYLKTDHKELFEWTLKEWMRINQLKVTIHSTDLYNEQGSEFVDAKAVQTTFENMKAPSGQPIFYLEAHKVA